MAAYFTTSYLIPSHIESMPDGVKMKHGGITQAFFNVSLASRVSIDQSHARYRVIGVGISHRLQHMAPASASNPLLHERV